MESWNDAYDLFRETCSDGHSRSAFRNTLRNSRDAFDAHFPNRRVGWLTEDGSPKPLGRTEARVFDAWRDRAESELQSAIDDVLAPKQAREPVNAWHPSEGRAALVVKATTTVLSHEEPPAGLTAIQRASLEKMLADLIDECEGALASLAESA